MFRYLRGNFIFICMNYSESFMVYGIFWILLILILLHEHEGLYNLFLVCKSVNIYMPDKLIKIQYII